MGSIDGTAEDREGWRTADAAIKSATRITAIPRIGPYLYWYNFDANVTAPDWDQRWETRRWGKGNEMTCAWSPNHSPL